MKRLERRATGRLLAVIFLLLAAALSSMDWGLDRPLVRARVAVRLWPVASSLAAGRLLEKFGAPDEVVSDRLLWRQRAPWLKIAVYREGAPGRPGAIVEHAVLYDNPGPRWWILEDLGIGARYEPVGEVLSAASSSEQADILALNVAVEVMEGRRDPATAQEFYRKTLDLALSGKSSPYARGLLFSPSTRPRPRRPGQLWPPPSYYY